MMDFTGYINSCDIRNHHRKIRYQYNALEAAWLVYWCRHITLEEKHEAWKWIVDNMPDQVLDFGRRKNAFQGQSLHRTIADFMEMQDWFIESFTAVSPDTVYTYAHCSEILGDGLEDFDSYSVFSTWQKCIDHILKTENHEKTYSACIYRSRPDEGQYYRQNGSIEIDMKGRVLNVDICFSDDNIDQYIDLDCFFETLWLEFPTPFQKGDIVYISNKYNREEPFVLTDIVFPSWKDGEEERKRRKECGGDCSDMNVWGYYMTESESFPLNGPDKRAQFIGADYDVWWNYMDVEYYRKELKGIDRCLKPISAYLKGELGENLALLLAAYHRIFTEEMYKKTMPLMFTKEGLQATGLMEESDNDN